MRVLLLVGTVSSAEILAGGKTAAKEEMTPPPVEESAKFAPSQFQYGVYCRETLKDDKKAYQYLELAAKQNYRPAWIYLADCYFARNEESRSYVLWSKLCLMAAEKIKADADTEFKIGMIEAFSGNLVGFKHWMKLAADKGYKRAAKMLTNPQVLKKITAMRQQRDQQENPDSLKQAIDSHHEKVRRITGTTGPEVLDQIAGRAAVSQISKMIKLPIPKEICLPNWNYNSQATEKLIAENLMADRDEDMRWITEEFKQQPIWENLLYLTPTIRAINATHQEELTKSLDASGFKRCSQEETKRLIKPFIDPNMPKDAYDYDVVWSLGNNLYFRINPDTVGRWGMRDYQFFLHKDGKSLEVETFPNPPDNADAALVAGILQNNLDCWNNLAIKYADGEMHQVFRRDDEAEAILKTLVKCRHAVGTYNLAVFYQNRDKAEEAKKYFALAKEFAARHKSQTQKPTKSGK